MTIALETHVAATLDSVRERSVDRSFLAQEQLDVASRDRVSAFPWRGQFTPGLVGVLLDSYGRPGATVLDPFVGSGTTLAEASRRNMESIGAEINPAALELARVFTLASQPLSARIAALAEVRQRLTGCLLGGENSLFGGSAAGLIDAVLLAYKQCSSFESANLMAVALMLAMGDSSTLDDRRLTRAIGQISQVVNSIPPLVTSCRVLAADARDMPLPANSVDVIITSPPYINVFNYHQNYRQAIERLGWQVLPAARSEIGSNRKHRQNRFLTVVQYSIDMLRALQEFGRVCCPGATIVIIVGRESRVRGISFANGQIIGCLAEFVPGMNFVRWQERRFTNRFGEEIYEEILTFETAASDRDALNQSAAAETGRQMLLAGLNQHPSAEVSAEIAEAIAQSDKVQPSPALALVRTTMPTETG